VITLEAALPILKAYCILSPEDRNDIAVCLSVRMPVFQADSFIISDSFTKVKMATSRFHSHSAGPIPRRGDHSYRTGMASYIRTAGRCRCRPECSCRTGKVLYIRNWGMSCHVPFVQSRSIRKGPPCPRTKFTPVHLERVESMNLGTPCPLLQMTPCETPARQQ